MQRGIINQTTGPQTFRWLPILLAALHCASAPAEAAPLRQTHDFDVAWRFLKADAPGAEQPGWDDSKWRQLDVPHDWSIEGPFAETNATGGAGAFLPSGVSWYRKPFTLPAADAERRVFVEFDGVMANSDVWINGRHLGRRPYGYVSFGYELTGHLKFDPAVTNVLAVRTDTSEQPASRWYTGAGIYRHVRLVLTDPVHLEQWGTFITTPEVSATQAVVRVQAAVTNQSDSPRQVFLGVSLLDPNQKAVAVAETKAQTISPGGSAEFSSEIVVTNPALWSLDRPAMYQTSVKVCSGATPLDERTTPFGIREFKFDAATGFWLNGTNLKLNGVCLHHDGGAFGAAVPLRVWERRLELLRKHGANAIRTAHNPAAPEFLDLCDRRGFLVMDEFFDCWTVGKNPYDYHRDFAEWSKVDARDTIRRDRNHPCIVLYCVGNEIHDTRNPEKAKAVLAGLVEVCHCNDPTRPVTQALFRPNVTGDYTNGLADLLDVIGTNYRDRELLAAHRANPARKIVGTEQRHDLDTWRACRDHPQHAGQFLWTGIDYLGEARRWPRIGFGSGLLDRTGVPRPVAFQRQSWWTDRPMVYVVRRTGPDELDPTDPGYESSDLRRPQVLFNDWTPLRLGRHEENVEVYSNCETVELLLNGRSLGAKPLNAKDSPRNWKVAFEQGSLQAVARNKGRVVARQELRTAGRPAKVVLSTDRTRLLKSWDEVAHVAATIVDEQGVLVPSAGHRITFRIKGPGVVATVDNGNNAETGPFHSTVRNAYQGRCLATVKATAPLGVITLTAHATGLESATVTMRAVNVVRNP
jgi:beta-galactosidase